MSWVATALVTAGVGTLTGAGASIYGAKKQDRFNKDQEAYQLKEKEKAEREDRRKALANAIKASKRDYMPQPAELPPNAPEMSGINTVAAVGNALGQLGTMAAGAIKPKPPVPTGPEAIQLAQIPKYNYGGTVYHG